MRSKLPSWLVWSEDMGETLDAADPIHAMDAEEAAREYGERSFNSEPWDGEMTVSVRPLLGGEVCSFAVEAIQSVVFDVRSVVPAAEETKG